VKLIVGLLGFEPGTSEDVSRETPFLFCYLFLRFQTSQMLQEHLQQATLF
jgi:hypothetical protein